MALRAAAARMPRRPARAQPNADAAGHAPCCVEGTHSGSRALGLTTSTVPTTTTLRSAPPLAPAQARAHRAITIALVAASLVLLGPYLPWLVLAIWTAALATPVVDRLAPRRDRRRAAAATVTLLIVVLVAAPLVGLGVALWNDARALLQDAMASGTGRRAIEVVLSEARMEEPAEGLASPEGALRAIRHGGPETWSFASEMVAGAARIALGIVVYLAGTYVGLVQGRRALAWGLAHVPLARRDARRLAAAFVETGRGLLVGFGLTGLAQAALAGIAYAVVGIERALVLAFLTFFASFVPTVGTGVVWVPVAIGLWITGRKGEAIATLAWNALVVSTVDNLLRPVLARVGRVDMHVLLLLVSMLGGLVTMGGWGLLLGPLVVRLTLEGVRIVSPRVESPAG